MKKTVAILIALLLTLSLFSCRAKGDLDPGDGGFDNAAITRKENDAMDLVTDEIGRISENPFVRVSDQSISTFSADVDTASYTYLRRLIDRGYTLPQIRETASPNLRTEELVNYFDYDYTGPEEGELFGRTVSIASSPWNPDTYLMVLGLQAKQIASAPRNNLVFLIDVSGSMGSENKLPLLQKSFAYLTEQLGEDDLVSIVTYSGKEEIVLDGCEGNRTATILNAIKGLRASGSTNGEAGLQTAYELAERNRISDGNNRIILASDGDLNVGISSPEELKNYISEKRDSGVFLSVLGFGDGNFRDDTMSALAQNGNGVYYYIDCEAEAKKIFGDDLLSTLYTVGKDVKLQITFDEKYVEEYRLIGYENRLLSTEDFTDDSKDAGEVGAGHTLTVCYELKLTEDTKGATENTDFMKLAIRYKEPEGTESILREYGIGAAALTETPSRDFRFVSAVVECSMILRESRFCNPDRTLSQIIGEMEDLSLPTGQAEFLTLMKKISK